MFRDLSKYMLLLADMTYLIGTKLMGSASCVINDFLNMQKALSLQMKKNEIKKVMFCIIFPKENYDLQ